MKRVLAAVTALVFRNNGAQDLVKYAVLAALIGLLGIASAAFAAAGNALAAAV